MTSWIARLALGAGAWLLLLNTAVATPRILLPETGLSAHQLAVIVNDADPLSVRIGRYYAQRRSIPTRNLIHVSFKPDRPRIDAEEFRRLRRKVIEATPAGVQAYALTWVEPFRVECMSMTTAFAAGFDRDFCGRRCTQTRISAYFDADSERPFDDFKLRPTMAIAALNFEQAKALIDRGVASDYSRPQGTGYLVSTSDKARNVRAGLYDDIVRKYGQQLHFEPVQGEWIRHRRDVLFYFTGRTRVKKLDTLTFLPGAVADHLTSYGGQLTTTWQMSSLRWLEAGATGSYGTVAEPCNFPQKFPAPDLLIKHYLRGETLLEAYWKSVAQPGQGLFIGEPLAKPFAVRAVHGEHGPVRVEAPLAPGTYLLQSAEQLGGPFETERTITVLEWGQALSLDDLSKAVYRLVAAETNP